MEGLVRPVLFLIITVVIQIKLILAFFLSVSLCEVAFDPRELRLLRSTVVVVTVEVNVIAFSRRKQGVVSIVLCQTSDVGVPRRKLVD
ncbi:hypothetical protein H0H87_009882 [Tephrocybe sp. NHM501043]|nr:hypothetical protein H0H87_009882 [Tephrocybe sp. NHM501043]